MSPNSSNRNNSNQNQPNFVLSQPQPQHLKSTNSTNKKETIVRFSANNTMVLPSGKITNSDDGSYCKKLQTNGATHKKYNSLTGRI